eukprot:1616784-Rhodomonas_salina.2
MPSHVQPSTKCETAGSSCMNHGGRKSMLTSASRSSGVSNAWCDHSWCCVQQADHDARSHVSGCRRTAAARDVGMRRARASWRQARCAHAWASVR